MPAAVPEPATLQTPSAGEGAPQKTACVRPAPKSQQHKCRARCSVPRCRPGVLLLSVVLDESDVNLRVAVTHTSS